MSHLMGMGGGRREKHGQTLQPRKASQLNVSQIQSGQVGKHQLRLWVGDKKKKSTLTSSPARWVWGEFSPIKI